MMLFSLSHQVLAQTWVPSLSPHIQNPENGHNYVLLTTSTWEAAETQAITMGGHFFNPALTTSQMQALHRGAFTPLNVDAAIQSSGGNVMLMWPEGSLTHADAPNGTWSLVTNAVSPYKVVPTAAKKFYRVKLQ